MAVKNGIPLIIGTAGGCGSRVHVEWLRDIISEIADRAGISFKAAYIYTDVSKEYVKSKLRAGKIKPMSRRLGITEEIDKCVRIVIQVGIAPIIAALDGGAQVVVAGRACDTAIYAAPCIRAGIDAGLAFHMAKIMECGGMCSEPVAAADVMTAEINGDSFTLEPGSHNRRCTVERVAAHTMYEQSNPYMIYEPDGVINLKTSSYTQTTGRSVTVRGSKFQKAEKPTLKLEGVKSAGFRMVLVFGILDPLTLSHIDEIFNGVSDFVSQNIKGVSPEDYSLKLLRYGNGNIIDAVGKTQAFADTVCALARSRMLHYDYSGRKSSTGNLAFPFSPSDLHVGEIFTFNLYHLAEVDSLDETAITEFVTMGVD